MSPFRVRLEGDHLGFPSCHDNWKTIRTVFKTRLFSSKAIESQAVVRERKAAEMVEFVGSRVGVDVDIGEVAFTTVFDSLSNLIFSRDCIGFEETKVANEVKSLDRKLMELAGAPNVVDFFPILEKLDPQGLKRETSRGVRELYSVWKPFVSERREILQRGERTNTDEVEDFLDVFLENGFDDDQIDWLGLEFTIAGTDTNSATIEWAMAELIRNRGAMNNLREELKIEF
ncbi:(S)-N-methylcoclaurine 3'-hydroxylase isozyme 1 (Fragment) [Linum perenne]